MGDDVATVLDKLGYKTGRRARAIRSAAAWHFGFAAQHPDMVRRLVLVSAGFSDEAFYPEMREQQKQIGAAIAEHHEGDADVQVVRRRRAQAR